MLALRMIGGLAVVRDRASLPLPASKKTRALLGYLAVTGRAHPREKLCDLLWDGPDDPRAALRWSLTKLRPLVDEDRVTRLVADRERVELVLTGAELDVTALRAAVPGGVAAGVSRASTEELRRVAPLASGELLEGVELPDCYGYDEWLRGERARVRQLQVAVLSALVDRLTTTAPVEALEHARNWVTLENLDENAHAAVLRLLAASDRRTEALAHLASCERLFRHELGRGLSRELERLRAAIGSAPAVAVASPEIASEPVTTAVHPQVATGSVLVGRVMERAALASMLDAPLTRVTMLLGDPGIGKTRLLDELAAMATARAMPVLRGRGIEAELVRPYGAWLDALAAEPSDPFRTASDRDADRSRLFEAITAHLIARGAERGLVVILDDLQWVDEASAALLHFVARSPAAANVRIACGARPGELADNPPALRLVRGLTREGAVHQIGLSPLDGADTAALAALHAPGVDVARVVAESGGHPLFAVEIARALARGETRWESLEALLAERIDLLDGTARELIPWAAALGGAFRPELLAAVSGVPLAELVRAVAELERRAFVRAVGDEWDFAHDLIRATAYHDVSEPRRRLLHLHIGRTLAAEPDADAERAGEIAHHAGLGGDHLLCATASLAASERCLRLFAPGEAAALADRGLSHVERLVGDDRARLQIGLLKTSLDADVRRQRYPAIRSALQRAILDAQAGGYHAAAARGWNALSRIAYETGDFASAMANSIDAADRARDADPLTQARTLAYSAHCLALLGRDIVHAEALAGEAATLLASSTFEVPELPFALALIRHHQGDPGAAITLLGRTTELAERDGMHWMVGYGWSRAALFELESGRPAEALHYCELLRTNAARFGDGAEVPHGVVVEAAAQLALGNGDRAVIDDALVGLRKVDAPGLLGATLTCIAELELGMGAVDDALRHAEEAVVAARRGEQPSELVLAQSILARIAVIDGRPGDARRTLDELARADVSALDARAQAVVAALRT